MASDVRITRQQLTTPSFELTRNISAGESFKQIGEFTGQAGKIIDEQAKRNYLIQSDTMWRKRLREIEQTAAGEPEALQRELEQYHDDLMDNIPADRWANETSQRFWVNAAPYINRAFEAKQARMDAEAEEQVILGLDEKERSLANISKQVFSSNPNVAQSAAIAAQQNILSIQQDLDTVKSDGTPMFSGGQRASRTIAIRDGFFQSAAQNWMLSQPNSMKALEDWRNGKLELKLPDGEGGVKSVNIRDAMSPDMQRSVDNMFMGELKDRLSIQNMMDSRSEKQFKAVSDQISTEFELGLQNGDDILPSVEAARPLLVPEKYVDLRKKAIQREPLTNESVKGSLLSRALAGEDVRDEARAARFEQKALNNPDFDQIVKIVNQNIDKVGDPVSNGRKFIRDTLGGQASIIGKEQSISMAKADAEYTLAVEDFIKKEGRQPSQVEIYDIARDVSDNWMAIDAENKASMTRKPKFMSLEQRTNLRSLRPEDMQQIKQKTLDAFKAKHNGDLDAMADDDEFREEMKNIDIFNNDIMRRRGTK